MRRDRLQRQNGDQHTCVNRPHHRIAVRLFRRQPHCGDDVVDAEAEIHQADLEQHGAEAAHHSRGHHTVLAHGNFFGDVVRVEVERRSDMAERGQSASLRLADVTSSTRQPCRFASRRNSKPL